MEFSDVDQFHDTFVTCMSMGNQAAAGGVEVWYDSRERYRVAYPDPNGSLAVSDGEKLWRYSPGEGSVVVSEAGIGGLSYGNLPGLAKSRLGPRRKCSGKAGLPDEVKKRIERPTEKRATVVRTEEYDGKECLVVRVEELDPPNAPSISSSESEQLIWIDREHWFPLKIRTEHRGEDGSSVSTQAYRNVTYDSEGPPKIFAFEVLESATVMNPSPPEPPQRKRPDSTDELRRSGYGLTLPITTGGTELENIDVMCSGATESSST